MVANSLTRKGDVIDFGSMRKMLNQLVGIETIKPGDPNTKKNFLLMEYLQNLQAIFEATGVDPEFLDPSWANDRHGYAKDKDNIPALESARSLLSSKRAANVLAIKVARDKPTKDALVAEGLALEKTIRREDLRKRQWLQCTQDIINLAQLGIEMSMHVKSK